MIHLVASGQFQDNATEPERWRKKAAERRISRRFHNHNDDVNCHGRGGRRKSRNSRAGSGTFGVGVGAVGNLTGGIRSVASGFAGVKTGFPPAFRVSTLSGLPSHSNHASSSASTDSNP